MNQLLSELRRRNVFRVAAAYLVGSWLVLQIVSAIEASAGLPAWTDGMALVVLVIGLPIALVVAWAFELTPEGMKKTEAAEGEVAIRPLGGTDYVLIGLMVVVLGLVGFQMLRSGPAPVAQPIAQAPRGETTVSIAVLPFVDLSEAGDQEYFSDGISEEILNVLVRIPELGVAGRTSSFAFKNQNQDLRIIGEALGVNHVLEGSVRRSGERLRITAQLIRSSDGFHIWSETYDRDLIDIFAIQDEIALAVSEQLAVSLGLNGENLVRNRTLDIEAYEAYLEARQLFTQRGSDNLERAALLLSETVARDPDFAPAWETLAGVYSVYESYQGAEDSHNYSRWRSLAEAAARRAIALDPEAAEAYAYLGVILLLKGEGLESFNAFERAVELGPDNPAVLDAVAQRMLGMGYPDRARLLAERAVTIDPMVAIYRNTLGRAQMRDPEVDGSIARETWRVAIEIDPHLVFPHNNAFQNLLNTGQREAARAYSDALFASDHWPWSDERKGQLDTFFTAWDLGEPFLRTVLPDLAEFDRIGVGIILGDMELFFSSAQIYWNFEPRSELRLFYNFPGNYRNDPRWRARVIEDGLLPLWQAHGFPLGCHALGDDDFECEDISQ